MPARGHKLGRFTVIGQLGSGGMGATYLAVWRGPHQVEQRVCIKTLNEEGMAIPGHMELFQREAALSASLRHPGVVSVLEVDTDRGFIAYEYIDGCDLRTLMGQRFSPILVVYVLSHVALALEHAHQRRLGGEPSPVIHRDISPSNIMVDRWGNVKVIDFGIGKAVREANSGVVKGKLPYMSPEQASAQELDGRTDQYSLGVVGYELVAGVRPNDGGDERETYARILTGSHTPLAELSPGVPAGLANVIERMLSTDRGRRFASMAAVVDALVPFTPPLNAYKDLAERVRLAADPQTVVTEAGEPVLVSAETGRRSRPSPSDSPARSVTPSEVRASTRTYASPAAPEGPSVAVGTVREARTAATLALPTVEPDELAAALTGRRGSGRRVAVVIAAVTVAAGLAWVLGGGSGDPAVISERDAALAPVAPPEATPPEATPPEATPPEATPSAPALPSGLGADLLPSNEAPGKEVAQSAAPPAAMKELAVVPAARTPAVIRPARRTTPKVVTPKPASESKPPGSVRVGVFPSGNVWIDGEARGPAPLTVELRAGRHTVAVGSDRPVVTRQVRVQPGQNESLVIDLSKAKAEERQ